MDSDGAKKKSQYSSRDLGNKCTGCVKYTRWKMNSSMIKRIENDQ